MAKKAKKVSWRTLVRRAAKARPKEAKRLKAKAAAMRRAERQMVADALSPAAEAHAVQAVRRDWQEVNEQTRGAGLQQATGMNNPGHGEIVGGSMAQLAERLVKLARKKGGTDAIQNELLALHGSAKYEGCVETDKVATKRLIETQQIIADRIVCGFIAEVDHTMQVHRGLPPHMTWMLNSFTITKIVDALNRAGYRASGKT